MKGATAQAVGLVHPGEMGAAIGAALVAAGHRVFWCAAGRSEATCARADRAGLERVADLEALAVGCERLLSVCPPHAALEVAEAIAAAGFRGVYVDANAVSPGTARTLAAVFQQRPGGVEFVDGGIVGPPPLRPGLTRLYLSGRRAGEVGAWFEDTDVEAGVIAGAAGAASALKMAYAGWTKGTTALLAAVWATAVAEGVDADLLREWQRSIPDLEARLRGLPGVGRKAWRFEGEMREIAQTLDAAGLPSGFHEAAAEVFARLAPLREHGATDLEELVRLLVNDVVNDVPGG